LCLLTLLFQQTMHSHTHRRTLELFRVSVHAIPPLRALLLHPRGKPAFSRLCTTGICTPHIGSPPHSAAGSQRRDHARFCCL
jgi:hypothetical protein